MKAKLTFAILKGMRSAGHDRIEDLIAMGYPRAQIYYYLSKRLKMTPQKAHFSRMNEEDVERAIAILEDMRMIVGQKFQAKEEKRLKAEAKKLKHETKMANQLAACLLNPNYKAKKKTSRKEYLEIVAANKKVSPKEIHEAIAKLPKRNLSLWDRILKIFR